MTTRSRRVARRLLEVLDYRTFAVAGAFVTVLLVSYIVLVAFQAAHDATATQRRSSAAASRRIDLLNAEILRLQAQIAAGEDERGQLAASVAALAEQVRQLGGRPVIVVTAKSPEPEQTQPRTTHSPSPRVTSKPRPTPTRTTRPSPTPSPTCTRLPVVGLCRRR